MRYFYIICLVLSSFFIYNQSSAENRSRQYAFFVPNNVYQNNTETNNIDSIRPRYARSPKESPEAKQYISQKPTTKEPKITLPYTRNQLKEETVETSQASNNQPQTKETETLQSSTHNQTPQIIETPDIPLISAQESVEQPIAIPNNAAKYNIDDDFLASLTPEPSQPIIEQEEKTISEMLSEIPFL